MNIRFSVAIPAAGWRNFSREVPENILTEFVALPNGADRIGFLRDILHDERFNGASAVIWTPEKF